MVDLENCEPKLIFFRETPDNLKNLPSLASSLQNLETSFLLISVLRFPHALVMCDSAVESAIKAALKLKPDCRRYFKDLISDANKMFPGFTSLSSEDIKNFRKKRNEIVHFGFSPKDDDLSCGLLLETGYHLIEHCYESFFQFSLLGKGDEDGGLIPDISTHLKIARNVFKKAKKENILNFSYCFISFAHSIRWGIQNWMLSNMQMKILEKEESSGWNSWEIRKNRADEITLKLYDSSWEFDCPVCHSQNSFVCELDDQTLTKKEVILKRGICTNCSLEIPENCPYIANELCADQLENKSQKILKEYGIQ